MADKQTGIKLKVSAVNTTGRVFKSIAASALGVTTSIAKWGAVAGAGALAAFAVTAKKLGELSDVAQSAGTTTEEITKLSTALGVLGVKGSSPEELASAFQKMTKATGQVGMEGFHNVIAEIAKLPDITDRSAAAMKVFGRAGMQFMPIIEGAAKNGIDALKDVEAGMPGISQAAADAGDAFADSMDIMKAGAAKVWNEGMMKVASHITGEFTDDVRTSALVCAAQMEYFAKAAWLHIEPFFTQTSAAFAQLGNMIAKWADNIATIAGGILVTTGENAVTEIGGFFYKAFAGADLLIANITGDAEGAARAMKLARDEDKRTARLTADNWKQTFDVLSTLKWDAGAGPLGNIDLSALQAQRDAAIEAARKAGAAIGKAAMKIGADESARLNRAGAQAGAAAKNVNPEALLGGTYKAVTFALRAGYATAQERIAKGVDKIATLLKDVKDNTAETAENLNFAEV